MDHQSPQYTLSSANLDNYLEKLPDELIMMIMRMVIKGEEHLHELLAVTIAKISARFKRLACDKSFWRGTLQVKNFKVVIELLNNGTDKVNLPWSVSLASDEIQSLAGKCPNLRGLWFPAIRSWPYLNIPWYSLKYLGICMLESIFENVELHRALPNLVSLVLRGCYCSSYQKMLLPDMRDCDKLKIVRLGTGTWRSGDSGIIPFPPGLRQLRRDVAPPNSIHKDYCQNQRFGITVLNLNRASVEEYLKQCVIKDVLFTS